MSLPVYGRYQLLKRLASGGMAEIFLARELKGKSDPVVLKRILPHLAENAEFVQMFLNEARIAVQLNQSNIVQVFELGEVDGSYFIAMEYIHGEDVRRVWKRAEQRGKVVPIALVCRIVTEACRALQYAHAKTDPAGRPLNIVHRDISPQNILLTFDGAVKLVDFGIAKAALHEAVTQSGVLKGKYSYMSPEQAQGRRLDRRSDIFALGIVLYELLTGTRLFKRSNDIQTLNAVVACEVVPPSKVNVGLPADLDPIVLKALARDPGDRYQEAGQLKEELERWLKRHGLTAEPGLLAGFMKDLYAERLAREAREGRLVLDDTDPRPAKSISKEVLARLRSLLESAPPPLAPPRALAAPEVTGETAAAPLVPEPPRRDEAAATRARPSEAARYPGSESATPALAPAPQSGPRTDRDEGPTRGRVGWALPQVALAAAATLFTAAAGFAFAPRPAGRGASITLTTLPPRATLVFDGRVRLLTPATLPPMPPGDYRFSVSAPGYAERVGTVHIPPAGRSELGPIRLEPLAPRRGPGGGAEGAIAPAHGRYDRGSP